MSAHNSPPITLLYHNVSSTTLPEVHMISGGQEYPVGVVHSVVGPDGQELHAKQYVPDPEAEIHTAEIHLPPENATEFLEYYKEHFVDPCVNGQFCHGLAARVLGWDHWVDGLHGERPVSPTRLVSGKAYSIVPPGKTAAGVPHGTKHTTFGTADPERNVSILGQDLPLAIMKNTDTMSLYGGEIRPTFDRTDSSARRRQAREDFRYRWTRRLHLSGKDT